LDSLCEFLSLEAFQTSGAETFKDAVAKLQKQSYSLVIADVNLPDGDGLELLNIIRKNHPQTVVIVITGYGTIDSAVRAIKQGAYDYLTKPIVDDELRLAVEKAVKQQSIISENERLRLQLEQKYSLENIISHNYKMAKIFELVEAVADTNTTILMAGPSGTGKSMFGHVKGSFTGAVSNKEGKFLAADEGTIFLDEVANASPALQVKLLRVLEDRQFEPVGSNKTKTVDTRIILASNRDLAAEVKQDRFREDLYYRINVITIELPPLHQRVGDIPLLAKHFLWLYCAQHNKQKFGITDEAMEYLERYSWPGNIRELENVIERAVLLSKDKFIDTEDLPESINQDEHQQQKAYQPMSLKEARAEPEKRLIQQALEANNWNRQETAKALQINRTTLYKKMKRYGLDVEAERLGLT